MTDVIKPKKKPGLKITSRRKRRVGGCHPVKQKAGRRFFTGEAPGRTREGDAAFARPNLVSVKKVLSGNVPYDGGGGKGLAQKNM